MKSSFLLLFSIALFSNTSISQSLLGKWSYKNNSVNMKFQFYPIQQNGYGYYEVTYANGNIYKDYYQANVQQIGLARFNNGQDQYFQILQIDARKLVLQDENFIQYHMDKSLPDRSSNTTNTNVYS